MFTGLVQAMGLVRHIERRGAGARLVIDAAHWDHRPAEGESISVSGVCLTCVEPGDPGLAHGILAFDCIAETLARSTLGDLAPGDRVNLEHAVRADTLMGGHSVQGHVDGVATVTRVKEGDGDWWVDFTLPALRARSDSVCHGHATTRSDIAPAPEPRGTPPNTDPAERGYGAAKQPLEPAPQAQPDDIAPDDSDLGDLMQYVVPKGSVTLAGVSLTVAKVNVPTRTLGVGLIPTTLAATTLGTLRPGDRVNVETDIIARTIVHWLRHFALPAGTPLPSRE